MADLSELEASGVWDKIRDPEDPHAWMVCGMNPESPKQAILLGRGQCGLERVRAALDPTQVQFGAFRVFAERDGVRRPKLVYFTFIGESAKIMAKAKAQNYKSSWAKFFGDVSLTLEIGGSPEELREDMVCERLRAAGGSQKAEEYVFGTGTDETMELEEIEAMRRAEEEAARAREEEERAAREEAERIAREEAEAARVLAEAKSLSIKQTKHSSRKTMTRAKEVKGFDFSALASEFYVEDLTDPTTERSWFVFSLIPTEEPEEEDGDGKRRVLSTTFQVDAEGKGSLDEITAALKADAVQYAVFRVNIVDRTTGTKAALRTRLIALVWTGDDCSPATQFASRPATAAVEHWLSDAQLILRINGSGDLASDFTTEAVSAAVRRHAGAFHDKVLVRFGFYDIMRQAADVKAGDDAPATA